MTRLYSAAREIISINQNESGRLALSVFESLDRMPSLLVSALTHGAVVIFETTLPNTIDVTHVEYYTDLSFILKKASYFASLGEFQITIAKAASSQSQMAQVILDYCVENQLDKNIKRNEKESLIRETKTQAIWIKFDPTQNKFKLFSPTNEQLERSLLSSIHPRGAEQPFVRDPFEGYVLSPQKEIHFQKLFGRFLQNVFDPKRSTPLFVYDSKWLEEPPILNIKVQDLIMEAQKLLPSNWLNKEMAVENLQCVKRFSVFLAENAKTDDDSMLMNVPRFTLKYLQWAGMISREIDLNATINSWTNNQHTLTFSIRGS